MHASSWFGMTLVAFGLLGCNVQPRQVVRVGDKVELAGELWPSLDADGRWDETPAHLFLHDPVIVQGRSGQKWRVKKLRLREDLNGLGIAKPVLVTGVVESTESGLEWVAAGGVRDDGYIRATKDKTVDGVSLAVNGSCLVLLREGRRTVFHLPGDLPVHAMFPSCHSDWRQGKMDQEPYRQAEIGFGSGEYARLDQVLWHGMAGGFRYLLLAVSGPTRPGCPNGVGGAGMECSIVWLKLDRDWRPLEEQHVTYNSYSEVLGECEWVAKDGKRQVSQRKRHYSVQVTFPADRKDYSNGWSHGQCFFDPAQPAKGFTIVPQADRVKP